MKDKGESGGQPDLPAEWDDTRRAKFEEYAKPFFGISPDALELTTEGINYKTREARIAYIMWQKGFYEGGRQVAEHAPHELWGEFKRRSLAQNPDYFGDAGHEPLNDQSKFPLPMAENGQTNVAGETGNTEAEQSAPSPKSSAGGPGQSAPVNVGDSSESPSLVEHAPQQSAKEEQG